MSQPEKEDRDLTAEDFGTETEWLWHLRNAGLLPEDEEDPIYQKAMALPLRERGDDDEAKQ
ncbi:hypothetical protein [Methylobacterium sp. WL8]|uniref:hypothetical protein n=1 Tax=Methylobacterium sp. WL8 TaxID=2603899 RepID=UPI0011C75581|nr:hypothetical protein [Methylobacterium sp. WL8]TXN76053.1 hypothetical protein FV234_24760 [Methylobacterium sp. WL8]